MTNSAFFNIDAERAFLAALPKADDAAKYIRRLSPEDFYDPTHKAIFEAVSTLALSGTPITLPAVAESMKKLHGSDARMADYTAIISEEPFTQVFALSVNADIIAQNAHRRKLYQIYSDAAHALCSAENEARDVMEDTRQMLRSMAPVSHARRGMIEGMADTIELLERLCKGELRAMPTGLKSLDGMVGGLHRGELTVIGARPAVGKSALGVHMALAAAEAGFRVLVCSREMSERQYHQRLFARYSDVSMQAMRDGSLKDDDWAQICDAATVCSRFPIKFVCSLASIEDLKTEVQEMAENEGLDLLVVDYLQLMQSRRKFDADYLRIGYVSRALKEIALDLNIAVIALAQVGRAAQGDMPTMAELRGSGDIEQDADNILFIHRPEDASDNCVRPDDRSLFETLPALGLRYVALGLAKARQGETGMCATLFNPARMLFTDINRGIHEQGA